jgi:hypothetical protein
VSLSRRRLRTLRDIEQDLAASDPGLSEFFLSFTVRADGVEMPRAERVARWPFRMLRRRGPGQTVTGRRKEWCTDNWNDP